MPRAFSPATAEQVVAAVEAVLVRRRIADVGYVSGFLDVPEEQAEAALRLAVDIGLLAVESDAFVVASPLCQFVATPSERQKAAVLRILMESYEPFIAFRQRLTVTTASNAAHETKTLLELDAHREEIKDTLISLGTYSGALVTEGGGHYRFESAADDNPLEEVAAACADVAAAELRIREQIGSHAEAIASRAEVVLPLSEGLLKAKNRDARGAVLEAGNAVESYLSALGDRVGVNLSGAHGINAKLARLETAGTLPMKLISMGKYLGHLRNAADHGVDTDVGAAWTIREATGTEYVLVACSFIAAARARELEMPPEI
jgi:hypothetical protein